MFKFDARTRFSRYAIAVVATVLLQACGGSDGDSPPQPGTGNLALLAGDVGGIGNLDGPRGSATFYGIQSLTVDPAGNLMVAESGNHALRKITPEGVVSTVAGGDMGSANVDGQGADAKFLNPQFVAADNRGNWYVSDAGDTIRKVTSAGVVSTLANVAADLDCPATCLKYKPLAVDPAGTVYFIANNKLRKLGPDGHAVTVVDAISSQGVPTPAFSVLYFPSSLVADSKGNIFIADRNQPVIRKVTPTGETSVLAGTIQLSARGVDGLGAAARFTDLRAIVKDASDNLYVRESTGAIRKITPDGLVTTVRQPAERPDAAWPYRLAGFARDAAGNYFISVMGNSANAPVLGNLAVLKIDPQGIESVYAGAKERVDDADGAGHVARFSDPRSPSIDPNGNVVVLDGFWDANTHMVDHLVESRRVRRISASGDTATVVRISEPDDGMAGAAVDKQGNTYVGGNRRIRVVAADGTIKTFFEGDSSLPDGFKVLAVDSGGSVYAAAGSREPAPNLPFYVPIRSYGAIYKVSANKAISLLAGKAGAKGHVNGTGDSALFSSIGGGTLDAAGNLYVADAGNHVIRKVTPAGVVSTIAGQPGVGGHSDGAAALAKFWAPVDVKGDAEGNLYVADRNNGVVRKIAVNGTVSTVVGAPAKFGFLPGALPGVIPPPEGIAVGGNVLYITTRNGLVRADL